MLESEGTYCAEHHMVYGGVKYKIDKLPLAGTSAKAVYYYDWYYCQKCLAQKFHKLDASSSTYEKILFNASPMQEGTHGV